MACEQALLSQRHAEIERDATSSKLELLKSEYYGLKSATSEKLCSLDARNASLQERLDGYEKLEAELDRTIVHTGALAATSVAATAEGGSAPLLRVPSSAQRRMEQCVGLSRDLVAVQGRADAAEAQLAQQRAEAVRVKSQLADAERRLRQAGQPQSYLAEQLEKSEAGRMHAEGRLATSEQQLGETRESLVSANHQIKLMRADLERLLAQRGSLDALRATLVHLLGSDATEELMPRTVAIAARD